MGIERDRVDKKEQRESTVPEIFATIQKPSIDDVREGYRLYNRMYGIGIPEEKIKEAIQKKFPHHSLEYITELIGIILNSELNIAK